MEFSEISPLVDDAISQFQELPPQDSLRTLKAQIHEIAKDPDPYSDVGSFRGVTTELRHPDGASAVVDVEFFPFPVTDRLGMRHHATIGMEERVNEQTENVAYELWFEDDHRIE